MHSTIDVRPFTTADAEATIALWKAVLPASTPWNDPRAALCRKRNQFDDLVFVAEHNQKIVGAIMAGYDGIRGWIYSLAVSPTHRKRGIGRHLIGRAEEALAQLGCLKVNLQIRSDNRNVISFYKKCGFATEDRTSLGKPLANAPPSHPDLIAPLIVSSEIRLSPIRQTDRNSYLKHLNETDEFHRLTATIPFPYTEFDADQWLSKVVAEPTAKRESFHWAIRNVDDELIGSIGLMNATLGAKAELGYWLAKPYWRRGIMTRVVRRLCRFAFEHLSLQRIHARVFSNNPASAAVLAKSGFELEGTLRKDFFKDGESLDVLIYGALSHEVRDPNSPRCDRNTIDSEPTGAEITMIDSRLEAYTAQQTGRDDERPIRLVMRDDDGSVIAGLKGLTTLDWMYIGTLWVDDRHRGNGIGTKLLQHAERIARRRSCIGACLTSFSFQAPKFYERHGYARCGEIPDYPIGGKLVFFAKRF